MPEPSSNQLILNFPAQPDDNFSNFIESNSSSLALRAAKTICDDPPCPFNALFIMGKSGLGKTHLLRAIGNHVAGHRKEKKALYIDGGHFVECFNKNKAMEDTLSKILSTDFFLLDNVHKISGNQDAQVKLHYLYNTLNQDKKKIVFTSNQSPEQLDGLADFMKSRFNWGMIVVLKAIDDATTALILKKLASDIGLEMPKSIITFLLNRIPRDFRSLRDAINAINQASYSKKQKVTIQLVKTVLYLK